MGEKGRRWHTSLRPAESVRAWSRSVNERFDCVGEVKLSWKRVRIQRARRVGELLYAVACWMICCLHLERWESGKKQAYFDEV
jgi:hypothetical protein